MTFVPLYYIICSAFFAFALADAVEYQTQTIITTSHDEEHRVLKRAKTLTIITGFINPPTVAGPTISGTSVIYSDHQKTKQIGTFGLSCNVNTDSSVHDVFHPCQLLFYFHPAGEIQKTTDVITASGFSIITNLSDLTQQPVLQLYAVTGGTGKYRGARGEMRDSFDYPGLNTFTVHLV